MGDLRFKHRWQCVCSCDGEPANRKPTSRPQSPRYFFPGGRTTPLTGDPTPEEESML